MSVMTDHDCGIKSEEEDDQDQSPSGKEKKKEEEDDEFFEDVDFPALLKENTGKDIELCKCAR